MYSSKVAFALLASIALASAQGGLGGILGGNNGNGGVFGGVTGGQGGVGGVTGGDGDLLGGLLGGILGEENGGLLGGILGNGGLGNLLDLLNNPALSILQPLLEQVLQLVENLLQNIQQVLGSLGTTLEGIINIITSGGPIEQQTQSLTELRNKNPVSFDTIFYIVSQLSKTNQGGNGGVVPTLPVSLPTPVSVPTSATPQIPV